MYHDGHLTQIVHDTPSTREKLAKLGYQQHNKFER
jgi:hypothetical protein